MPIITSEITEDLPNGDLRRKTKAEKLKSEIQAEWLKLREKVIAYNEVVKNGGS
jgi:hypothetical protein